MAVKADFGQSRSATGQKVLPCKTRNRDVNKEDPISRFVLSHLPSLTS
jgi:hypothetical protein